MFHSDHKWFSTTRTFTCTDVRAQMGFLTGLPEAGLLALKPQNICKALGLIILVLHRNHAIWAWAMVEHELYGGKKEAMRPLQFWWNHGALSFTQTDFIWDFFHSYRKYLHLPNSRLDRCQRYEVQVTGSKKASKNYSIFSFGLSDFFYICASTC